ncbi:hypothetical protein GIB67_033014 [Kingdonia uniflora]|uniref:Myb/SANT-like domain-containing protein n=1 Tax=Kingdonia uniflora TaxID=39325 RepID=A0A7J7MYR5_9MAGN|nr:hypothetical protein GIB67_033014 [Kingdonia uniflora]
MLKHKSDEHPPNGNNLRIKRIYWKMYLMLNFIWLNIDVYRIWKPDDLHGKFSARSAHNEIRSKGQKDVVDVTNELGMKATKNNLVWSNVMDAVMIKVLQDQLVNGGKGDAGGVKTWWKWAPEVKFVTNLSGFGWDDESKTITGDANVWKTLIEVNGNKKYRGKTIVNYTTIYELVGKDIATGSRAHNVFTLDDEMTLAYNGNDNNIINLDVDIENSVMHDTQDPSPTKEDHVERLAKNTPSSAKRQKTRSTSLVLHSHLKGLTDSLNGISQSLRTRSESTATLLENCGETIDNMAGVGMFTKFDAMKQFTVNKRMTTVFLQTKDDQKLAWLNYHFGSEQE